MIMDQNDWPQLLPVRSLFTNGEETLFVLVFDVILR